MTYSPRWGRRVQSKSCEASLDELEVYWFSSNVEAIALIRK